MVMSFSIFSQGIKPRIQLIGKDTFFCFTIPQSKIIAKDLEKGRYCDSIRIQTECELEAIKEQTQAKDTTILILQEKIRNQTAMAGNQNTITQTLTEDLQASKKSERKERLQKRFFAVTTFIFLGFAILK